jgi:PAS domain S-box-containing protein
MSFAASLADGRRSRAGLTGLTFRARLLLILGLAIALAAVGKATVKSASDAEQIDHDLRTRAEAIAQQGAKSLTTAVWELNRDQALQILGGLALNPDFQFATVVDPVEQVFVQLGQSNGQRANEIIAARPIVRASGDTRNRLGELSIGLSRSRVAAQRREAIAGAVGGAVVDFVVVFLAAVVAVSLVSRPMEAISRAMLRVANGHIDTPTPYRDRHDQIGHLAQAVELFRSEIGRRIGVEEDLRTVHTQLELRIDERTAELRLLNQELAGAVRERELAEQRLIDAINSIPDGFVLYGPDDRLIFCNEYYRNIYGHTRSLGELRGRTFEEITRPVAAADVLGCATPEAVEEWLRRRVEHHRNAPVEPFMVRFTDGRWIQVDERRTKEGGCVSVCVDITKQTQVMQALEQSEAKFRGLLAASPDALLAVDSKGAISIANRQTESLFGYRRDELIGLPLQQLIPQRFRDTHARHVSEYHATPTERSMGGGLGLHAVRKDGREFPVEISLSPYIANGETLVLTAVRDITARKEAETALRQMQKMEALGTLAGGIAHDLNNTLVPIIGLTQLTAAALPDGSPERESLDDVLSSATHAAELVAQILAFSRAEKQDLASADLTATIRESLRLLRSAIPPTIQLKVDLPDQPIEILCNGTQIHQVMMNLCANAAHAVGDKQAGIISVRLTIEAFVPKHGDSGSTQPRDYAKLSVSDNGTGMDKDTIERLFEPFFTTKGVGEGTGLGLAVVHGVVHAHHGHIAVQSQLGNGTTFDVFLPIKAG